MAALIQNNISQRPYMHSFRPRNPFANQPVLHSHLRNSHRTFSLNTKIRMCITTERNSTICGHRESFTEKCKKETHTSFLNHFRKCSFVLNSTFHHELCYDCRHFWWKHRLSESEAIERTREYRADHNYYAPLSPQLVLHHNGRRSKDENSLQLNRKNESEVVPWPGKSDEELNGWAEILLHESGHTEPLRCDRKGKGIDRSVHPLKYRAGENASQVTLWPLPAARTESYPEFPPPQQPQRTYRSPSKADSNQTGLETIVVGMEHLPPPDDFELGNIDRPLPLRVNRDGFHREELYFPKSQSRLRIDLGKPLPRPPRCDSPMPGCPFDSQNPERDLPANMYYPRFI